MFSVENKFWWDFVSIAKIFRPENAPSVSPKVEAIGGGSGPYQKIDKYLVRKVLAKAAKPFASSRQFTKASGRVYRYPTCL